jgi:hypothetical protein
MSNELLRPLLKEYHDPNGLSQEDHSIKIDPSNFNAADLDRLKEEFKAKENQQELDRNDHFLRGIKDKYRGESHSFRRPFPSVEIRLKEAAGYSHDMLKQAIEIEKAEIEDLCSLKEQIIAFADEDRQAKAMWANTPVEIYKHSHGTRSVPCVHSWSELQELLELGKAEVWIADFWIRYHTKLKKGYEDLLKRLTEEAPKIVAEKLNEIQNVVDQGVKVRENMVEIAAGYRKRDSIEGKEATRYEQEKDRFTALQRRYQHLYAEMIRYGDPSDLKIPLFPASLNMDERTGEAWILEVAEKERRERAAKEALRKA